MGGGPSLSRGFLRRVTSGCCVTRIYSQLKEEERGGWAFSPNEARFGRDDLFLVTSASTTLARTVYAHHWLQGGHVLLSGHMASLDINWCCVSKNAGNGY